MTTSEDIIIDDKIDIPTTTIEIPKECLPYIIECEECQKCEDVLLTDKGYDPAFATSTSSDYMFISSMLALAIFIIVIIDFIRRLYAQRK